MSKTREMVARVVDMLDSLGGDPGNAARVADAKIHVSRLTRRIEVLERVAEGARRVSARHTSTLAFREMEDALSALDAIDMEESDG